MEINKLIIEQITELITDFLNNDKDSVNLPFLPINEYAITLSELGFSTLSNSGSTNLMNNGNDWETNGWQVDFWWTIFRDSKKYMLSGSLFYGRISISKYKK